MRIRMNKGETAYDAVSKIIESKYGDRGESIVVQLRQKYDDFDPWEELTVLYENNEDDLYSLYNRKYIWEYDWWEGQEFVELIAAAPVSDIKLDHEPDFRFIWEYEYYSDADDLTGGAYE